MRCLTLALLTLALLPATLLANEPMTKSEAEARAALALAKAKLARAPAVAAKSKSIPWSEAKKLALKDGKPIFLTVKIDCTGLCGELRPQFITCHEAAFEGSDKPRAVLLLPDSNGNLWRVHEWFQLPNAMQVRQTAAEKKKTVAEEPAAGSVDLLMASFVAGLVAVEPAEFTQAPPGPPPAGWAWNCPGNGPCQLVPVTPEAFGYTALPAAGGPVTVGFPQASAGADGFVARFPRLAQFRGRIRGALALPPPRVAGGFISFPAPAMPQMTTTQTTAQSASTPPAAVAGPASEFVQIGKHRVPVQLIERARKAGLSWSTIFRILITAGIDVLQHLLEELGR